MKDILQNDSITTLTQRFTELFSARGLEGRTFTELSKEFANAAFTTLDSDLIKRLHAEGKHPDYEYESVEHPYKAGYSNKPEGQGWETNVHMDEGLTRYDNTEDHHYYRLKTWAGKDEIKFYDLPKISLNKVTIAELLAFLRGYYADTTMAGGTGENVRFSKYEYTQRSSDIFNAMTSDFYAWSYDPIYGGLEKDPFQLRDYSSQGSSHKAYLVLCLPGHPFRILIDMYEPDGNVWVSVETKDHSPGPWRQAPANADLPINILVLEKELSML